MPGAKMLTDIFAENGGGAVQASVFLVSPLN